MTAHLRSCSCLTQLLFFVMTRMVLTGMTVLMMMFMRGTTHARIRNFPVQKIRHNIHSNTRTALMRFIGMNPSLYFLSCPFPRCFLPVP